MNESTNAKEVFLKLKEMEPEEIVKMLKEANITKDFICDSLFSNPQLANIPMKGMLVNAIQGMSEEEFINFVSNNISKVPSKMISKIL